jgi:hypothetical protein
MEQENPQIAHLKRRFRDSLKGPDFATAKQIPMSDEIVFLSTKLQPPVSDPDQTENTREMILETDRKNKIKVTFAYKPAGSQITIRVLELDGQADFGSVKVAVRHGSATAIKEVRRDEPFSFELADAQEEIFIRLFR